MIKYIAETPRLYLETLSEKHLHGFHELWSTRENMNWSTRPTMHNLAQSLAFLQKENLTSARPEIDKYAVMLKHEELGNGKDEKEPVMIGVIGTKSPGNEMVYMLKHQFWGHGYMSEAIDAFVGPEGIYWDLETRNDTKTLLAEIDAQNQPSIRIMQKLKGSREGGIARASYGLARDKLPDGTVPKEKMRDMVSWYVDRPLNKH